MPKLTDIAIKKMASREKQYSISDGGGLSLLVKPNGTKAWRFNYRFAGKQKTLALGVYPEVSLKAARDGQVEAKQKLKQGVDPSQEKKRLRRQVIIDAGNSFESLAFEWWNLEKGEWTADHAQRIWTRLKDNAFADLGHRPIHEIEREDVIEVIDKIQQRGSLDVARRVLQDIRRVCRYAVEEHRLTNNPAADLTRKVKKRKVTHRASLPREALPAFLRELDDYKTRGRLLTMLAIKLLVLTFVRSGELRGARWEEFDLQEGVWRIPGNRMKMKVDHIVPLALQAVDVIKQIAPLTSQYDLVFPSERRRTECMSDNTMRRAIFKMGYDGNTPGKNKCVPHGFRATASSILNESGFNPDAIERQLAHKERNGVRASYTHHAHYLDERKRMMQWWADYIDELKGSGKVIPLFAKQN